MAKIIFSTISGLPNSDKLPCFYEGWINALVREGNDVMLMITNKLMENPWTRNNTKNQIDKKALDKVVTEFNPDFVITCNNSLYENIPSLLSCPIAIYAADSPAVFADRELLKKNIGRYDILVAGADSIPMVKDYFGNNARSINLMHFATDFVAEDVDQDKNISFIGTDFSFSAIPFKKRIIEDFNEKEKQQFCLFLNSFKQNVLVKPEDHIKKLGLNHNLLSNIAHIELLNLLSSNFRIQILEAIADFGLALYGSSSWVDICNSSVDVALAYKSQEVSSVKDNQDIYNSSKISINISHAQAGRAFSWRVRDIMACNSALVSDPREDLVTLFGKYVKIPTYENNFEARQICQKLLADDIWRRELVAGSKLAIESENRFHHRLKQLEEIFGLKFFDKNKIGSLRRIEFEKFNKIKL